MTTALQDKIAELTAAAAEDASVTNSATNVIAALLAEVQAGVSAGDLSAIQDALTVFKENTGKMAAAIAVVPAP